MLKSDKDGFLTGGLPVTEVRRSAGSDGILFDIRTDVRAIRKAVQAGVSKTNSGVTRTGSKPISDPSFASVSRPQARPTGRLKGDGGAWPPSGVSAMAGVAKAGQATKARNVSPVAAGVSAAMSPADQAYEKHRAAVERSPVKAGERDARGRFAGGSNRVSSGDLGGGMDSSDSVASKFADKISQAVDGIGGVGDADPAVRAIQEVAEPVSRAYGALRGDKDARRQDGWFKRILKGLQRIEEKGSQPVEVEQSGTFALLGRFIPALLPVLAGLAATAAAIAAYLKIEGYVSDGEKAKEGADAIKDSVSDPLKEAIKPVVDTNKRAEDERSRVLNARDGEYAKEDALKKSFVSPTGAAVGSKQWNDEFYKFSQDELAKQEAESKKGFIERASDSARDVAGKARGMAGKAKGWVLGQTSKMFESGKGGAGTVSSGKGDHGGASYGTYQLSSTKGMVQAFLKGSKYGSQFDGLTPGTPEFNDKWKQIAKSDPTFGDAQHDFIKRTNFDPAMSRLAQSGLDFSKRGPAVQDAVWSTSVHMGAGGGSSVIQKALGKMDVSSMSDAQIVSAIQDYKLENNDRLFRSSSQKVRDSTAARATAEKGRLISLAAAEAPAVVSAPAPPSVSVREAPRISDAPKVQIPLATSGSGATPTVIAMKEDAGRDVSDRRIAHIVTGGIAPAN